MIVTKVFAKAPFRFFDPFSIALPKEVQQTSKLIELIELIELDGDNMPRKLTLVLKCYVVLDMVDTVQTYYRENFIIPYLEDVITRVCLI